MSYHNQRSKDGKYRVGDVVRMGKWSFADAVILGFNDEDYAKLARPYVYATETGNSLTGVELISMVSRDSLEKHYILITRGRVL